LFYELSASTRVFGLVSLQIMANRKYILVVGIFAIFLSATQADPDLVLEDELSKLELEPKPDSEIDQSNKTDLRSALRMLIQGATKPKINSESMKKNGRGNKKFNRERKRKPIKVQGPAKPIKNSKTIQKIRKPNLKPNKVGGTAKFIQKKRKPNWKPKKAGGIATPIKNSRTIQKNRKPNLKPIKVGGPAKLMKNSRTIQKNRKPYWKTNKVGGSAKPIKNSRTTQKNRKPYWKPIRNPSKVQQPFRPTNNNNGILSKKPSTSSGMKDKIEKGASKVAGAVGTAEDIMKSVDEATGGVAGNLLEKGAANLLQKALSGKTSEGETEKELDEEEEAEEGGDEEWEEEEGEEEEGDYEEGEEEGVEEE